MKSTKIIFQITIVLLAIGCKKEGQPNLNIAYTNINKTLIANSSNKEYILDVDQDGLDDLKFYFYQDGVNPIRFYSTTIEQINDSLFYHCLDTRIDLQGVVRALVTPIQYSEGQAINSMIISGFWSSNIYLQYPDLFAQLKNTNTSETSTYISFTDAAKSYIAIRLNKNGKKYFGWIRVSLSVDGNTITIYDAAISKVADIEIKAGEK